MKRLQGNEWKDYQKEHPKARIMRTVFSHNHHVCIYGNKWYHWCNDVEIKNVFDFIRNNKTLFTKDICNPRIFNTVDYNTFTLNLIKAIV